MLLAALSSDCQGNQRALSDEVVEWHARELKQAIANGISGNDKDEVCPSIDSFSANVSCTCMERITLTKSTQDNCNVFFWDATNNERIDVSEAIDSVLAAQALSDVSDFISFDAHSPDDNEDWLSVAPDALEQLLQGRSAPIDGASDTTQEPARASKSKGTEVWGSGLNIDLDKADLGGTESSERAKRQSRMKGSDEHIYDQQDIGVVNELIDGMKGFVQQVSSYEGVEMPKQVIYIGKIMSLTWP